MPGAVILVVDDEPPVCRLMESVLKAAGYCVYTAQNAAQAVVLAHELGAELDVLLCDIFLRHYSGLELIHVIRRFCPEIKIILISGEFTNKDEQAPFKIGEEYYQVLSKPFTKPSLLHAVDQAINSRSDSLS